MNTRIIDEIGSIADEIESLLFALKMPLRAQEHIGCLENNLPEIIHRLRVAYKKLGGPEYVGEEYDKYESSDSVYVEMAAKALNTNPIENISGLLGEGLASNIMAVLRKTAGHE